KCSGDEFRVGRANLPTNEEREQNTRRPERRRLRAQSKTRGLSWSLPFSFAPNSSVREPSMVASNFRKGQIPLRRCWFLLNVFLALNERNYGGCGEVISNDARSYSSSFHLILLFSRPRAKIMRKR